MALVTNENQQGTYFRPSGGIFVPDTLMLLRATAVQKKCLKEGATSLPFLVRNNTQIPIKSRPSIVHVFISFTIPLETCRVFLLTEMVML